MEGRQYMVKQKSVGERTKHHEKGGKNEERGVSESKRRTRRL